jgi:hypothetical protein
LFRVAVFAAAAVAALVLITPAPGATECAKTVLRDWSDDGRVAAKYLLPCYEEAIDALPTDLRDYTNAEDAITRALTQATRQSGAKRPVTESSGEVAGVVRADGALPLPLVAVAVASAVLLAGGVVGYALRRTRAGA